MTKIYIAIITYQRPVGLCKLLLALKTQCVDGIEVSVLVVDNDCTGANSKIVNSLLLEYPFGLILVEEPKQGIVAARNRAVNEFLKSDSEILVFIDDDEWPVNDDWLISLRVIQEATACDIVYSDVYTIPETRQIQWVETALRPKRNNKSISGIKKFYTNNLLVTRKVLEKVVPAFDGRFALTGSSDLHFSIKCVHAGFQAIYTPFSPVQEIFPTSKATMKWFFLRGYRSGEGATRANIYEGTFPGTYIRCMGMGGVRFLYGMWQLIKAIIMLDKSLLANSLLRLGSSIGTFAGFFNLSYNEYRTSHGI